MRKLYIIILLSIGANTVSGQIIGDNVFAFGFENIFEWNILVLNEIQDSENIRMMMFEDIETSKVDFITF